MESAQKASAGEQFQLLSVPTGRSQQPDLIMGKTIRQVRRASTMGRPDGQAHWAPPTGKMHWHISPTSVVAVARALLRNALTGTDAMSLLSLL